MQTTFFVVYSFDDPIKEKSLQVILCRLYPGKNDFHIPTNMRGHISRKKGDRNGKYVPLVSEPEVSGFSYALASAASAGTAAAADLYFLKAFQPS